MTTNFGGMVVVPLQGAIVVCYGSGEDDDQFWWSGRGASARCHCSVLWLRGRVTANFGREDVVPLLGAIAGCHCSVLRCGKGEGRPSLGEWCHCCHCCVLWLGGRKTTIFGGVDVVPLLGAHTQQWYPDKLP